MATKRWTLPTLMRQLTIWVADTYEEDLLDPDTTVRTKPFGVVLDDFIGTDLRERIAQIPGQTRIKTDDNGEVTIKELKDDGTHIVTAGEPGVDDDITDPKSD